MRLTRQEISRYVEADESQIDNTSTHNGPSWIPLNERDRREVWVWKKYDSEYSVVRFSASTDGELNNLEKKRRQKRPK